MIRSSFSNQGLDIGENNVNLTYAYGLGDFFSTMFEDTSLLNLMLEADTLTASEVYSRFLQLTSGMSLEDVQVSLGCQIKLVLLNSADLVAGTPSTYRLPESVVSSRYVANRPFLPTELLESKVDFDIYQEDSGDCYIRFARILDHDSLVGIPEYAFSSRLLADGTTQYALWFADAHVDEKLVASSFGNLIGAVYQTSSEAFANFVYGLYYVYTQGPTLTVLRRGLNLVLGIPLARLAETVIDIRMYLQTDQYIVVTDQNQYIIPYGLPPSVNIGDILQVGQELAQWVEVKDYQHDGDWWLNLYIPSTIVPQPPSSEASRYASAGSQMDYIMRKYLKTHTFLVRVNVTTFKNVQTFTELFNIIRQSKPSYAQPVYVWAVANNETANVVDSGVAIDINNYEDDDLGTSMLHMKRCSVQPLGRGRARFIRFNAPAYVDTLLGRSTTLNSSNSNIQTLPISGYSNPQSLLRGNSWEELDWMSVLASRSSDTWRGFRSQVGYRRGNVLSEIDPVRSGEMVTLLQELGSPQGTWSLSSSDPVDGPWLSSAIPYAQESLVHQSIPLSKAFSELPEGSRIIPLAVISVQELDAKLQAFNIPRSGFSRMTFPLYDRKRAINTHEIQYPVVEYAIAGMSQSGELPSPLAIAKFFGTRLYSIAAEDTVTNFLDNPPPAMNKDMCASMLYQGGPDLLYAAEGDQILVTFINCSLAALYLVSQAGHQEMPAYLTVEEPIETAEASVTGIASRGMGLHNSPFYLRRGSITLLDNSIPPPEENPSTELANYLYSQNVPETARVVPLTFITEEEAEAKSSYWEESPLPASSKYHLLPHPYPYRNRAEVGLKKASSFISLSPSSCKMFQDAAGTIPVTGMEQPVGLVQDMYGLGASASQALNSFRPVVSARYNSLSYTSFEGTVPSSGFGNVGTPPANWTISSVSAGGYITQYSNSTVRIEATAARLVLQYSTSIEQYRSAVFRIVVTLNPQLLVMKELFNVVGNTATFYANGVEVDPSTHVPKAGTELRFLTTNSTATPITLLIMFGVGVTSSSVTGVAAFKEPDLRSTFYVPGLPPYQRVGNPTIGLSLAAGNPDYQTEGFPPYLIFRGGQYLVASGFAPLFSSKLTASSLTLTSGGSIPGTVFDFVADGGQLDFKLASVNTEAMSYSLSNSTGNLQLRYNTGPYSIKGPISAVVDTGQPSVTQQMVLYKNKTISDYTTISGDTIDPVYVGSGTLYIGVDSSLTNFFQGMLFGLTISGSALTISDREAVEDWLLQETARYVNIRNPELYHYPDFFRRDAKKPSLAETPTGNFYENTPVSSLVDTNYRNDRVLLYRYTRSSIGLYWICNNSNTVLEDYWGISYSGVPSLTRVSSGIPEQQGLVVVDPYAAPTSLNYDYLSHAVDSRALNTPIITADSVFIYSDSSNPSVAITRGGMTLNQPLLLR